MWTLERIWIYPIKSLPGIEVSATELLPAGNLLHDREYALVDDAGRFMNAKRTADIHRIRADWELDRSQVRLSTDQAVSSDTFSLDDHRGLGAWFSEFFATPLSFVQKSSGGFPDDTEASGPTVISVGTLRTVAAWFPGLSVDEIRRRFRPNLILNAESAFAEDALFAAAARPVPFRVGDARLAGTNPCQRCVVPTRDSHTGEVWSGFQKAFSTQREATLPGWSNRSRFNHYYRLSVNTVVLSDQSQVIRVGDLVYLEETEN